MKIRNSFVTNSSSSSFVIEKSNANSIDNCYQLVKMAYIEMFEKVEEVKKQIKSIKDYPIMFDEENSMFKFKKDIIKKWDNEKRWEFEDRFEETFGVTCCVRFYVGDIGWLETANTYDEYVEYWINKIKENKGQKYMVHAPFIIVLLNKDNTPIVNVMYGNDTADTEYKTSNKRILDNVIGWYDDEIETKENIIGNCCIYSEDGYIPYMVVDILSKFSSHSCTHMG